MNVFALLRRPAVAYGMAAILLLFMGQFALFTYLRPFLETVTKVDVTVLSLLLLVIGVAGLTGTSLIGALLTSRLSQVLTIIPLGMAALAIALTILGSGMWATTALLAVWGLVATPAPVAWGWPRSWQPAWPRPPRSSLSTDTSTDSTWRWNSVPRTRCSRRMASMWLVLSSPPRVAAPTMRSTPPVYLPS